MSRFFTLAAEAVPPSPRKVARFLGYPYGTQPASDVASMIDGAIVEMRRVLRPNVVYDEFPLCLENAGAVGATNASSVADGTATEKPLVYIADFAVESSALAKNLAGCESVVLFAATIGSDVDMLIRRYQKTDAAKASVMQAAGAMFAESLVDVFNDTVRQNAAARGCKARPRFSPGYGDVSLEVQRQFFRHLDCAKIGLTLMDTLIMAPEKSVTVFIGIACAADSEITIGASI